MIIEDPDFTCLENLLKLDALVEISQNFHKVTHRSFDEN